MQYTYVKYESLYIAMDKLPTTIIQQIYEYDNTYKDVFDKVLLRLDLHCFIYRCRVL